MKNSYSQECTLGSAQPGIGFKWDSRALCGQLDIGTQMDRARVDVHCTYKHLKLWLNNLTLKVSC